MWRKPQRNLWLVQPPDVYASASSVTRAHFSFLISCQRCGATGACSFNRIQLKYSCFAARCPLPCCNLACTYLLPHLHPLPPPGLRLDAIHPWLVSFISIYTEDPLLPKPRRRRSNEFLGCEPSSPTPDTSPSTVRLRPFPPYAYLIPSLLALTFS